MNCRKTRARLELVGIAVFHAIFLGSCVFLALTVAFLANFFLTL